MKAKLLVMTSVVQGLGLGCLAAAPPVAGEMRELAGGEVTIPYAEWRAMWEAGRARQEEAQAKVKPPPVGHCWKSVECVLTFAADGSSGAFEARFDGEVLVDGWQEVFLLGGGVNLEEVDAGGRAVTGHEGTRLLVNEPGKVQVAVKGTTAGWRHGQGDERLRIKLPAAAVKRFAVRGLPDGHEVKWNGTAAGGVKTGEGVVYHLAGGEEEVSLAVVAAQAQEVPQPSEWRLVSRVLVQPEEGRLRHLARVSLTADTGSGLEAVLELPPNAAAVEAEGVDMAESELLRGADGRKRLRVRWHTRDLLDRELDLCYQLPQSPLAETWKLAAPTCGGRGDDPVLYAVVLAEGMEFDGGPLRVLPPQRLGQRLRELLGDAPFVTAEGGAGLELKARWLPVVATAEAVVSEAKAQLRVVDDGSMQTTAAWTIRHQGALVWRLEIPDDIELLSCHVAGKPVKPVRRQAGELEFALPATPECAKTGTAVAITYVGKTEPLDPVGGRVALELPRTSLFLERLEWAVSLPARFEVTAVEGNVSVTGQATGEGAPVILGKELCRGEKPAAGFFYQRREFVR